MKKVIAVLLSILCLMSCFGGVASAEVDGGLIDLIQPDEPLLYCLVYKKQTLSDVKMMYQPNPDVVVDGPGYVTVTKDTPLAIDHDFVCWKDKNGKLYYAGDQFYVDGECVLYAVWEKKQGNSVHAIRVFQCAMLTFERMILKALGIFKDIKDFTADRTEAMTKAVTAFNAAVNEAKAQSSIKITRKKDSTIACQTCAVTGAKESVDALLDNYEYRTEEVFTVTSGVTETGAKATDIIRPYGEDVNFAVDDKLVSATLQETEEGEKKIVLTLATEDSSFTKGLMVLPEEHSKFFAPLDFTGDASFKEAKLSYSKTKIYATIDKEGKLSSLSITAPVSASSTVVLQSLLVENTFDAVIRERYEFKY